MKKQIRSDKHHVSSEASALTCTWWKSQFIMMYFVMCCLGSSNTFTTNGWGMNPVFMQAPYLEATIHGGMTYSKRVTHVFSH